MSDHPTPGPIMELGFAFWGAKTLLAATELGLFTELAANGPQTEESLSRTLDLHRRSARDFLDALVALGMLDREDGKYGNTRDTEAFLDKNKTSYVGGWLEMANSRLYPFWGNLTEGLKTGEPQNEAKTGGDLFDAIYGNPETLKVFLHSMTSLSMGANITIANKFPWDRYKSFVDVGTAQGGLAVQIALANGHLTGSGYDLPVAREIFESYVTEMGLTDRLSFAPGSFFDDPMPQTDVITMGHILHDWDLDTKRMLLQKAYEALNPGGAVIIYETLIDDDRSKNAFGLLMSLNMLIETRGGFDYTGADCQGWMTDIGFKDTYVEHLVGPDSMVIGFK
ncbi:MAG: methyltransferase [Chloroflexi bacterium]|nr:methyltransferase [Chloroflexota bacterium]